MSSSTQSNPPVAPSDSKGAAVSSSEGLAPSNPGATTTTTTTTTTTPITPGNSNGRVRLEVKAVKGEGGSECITISATQKPSKLPSQEGEDSCPATQEDGVPANQETAQNSDEGNGSRVSTSFPLTIQVSDKNTGEIHIAKSEDLVQSHLFSEYLQAISRSVEFRPVQVFAAATDTRRTQFNDFYRLNCQVTCELKSDPSIKTSNQVVLEPRQNAILMVLRVDSEKPREHVLFVRRHTPLGRFAEIPHGSFSQSGVLTGPCADVIGDVLACCTLAYDKTGATTKYTIYRSMCSDLTVRSNRRGFGRRPGGRWPSRRRAAVRLAPHQGNSAYDVHLFRKTVTVQEFEKISEEIREYSNKHKQECGIHLIEGSSANLVTYELYTPFLVSLGEAWTETNDAKSMAALLLFHEYRYHGWMPRYRPPEMKAGLVGEAGSTGNVIKLMKVSELDPNNTRGNHLLLKLVTPPQRIADMKAPAKAYPGKPPVDMFKAVMGDETGIVTVLLDESEVTKHGESLQSVGPSFLLRSARIDMSDNLLKLRVTHWARLLSSQSNPKLVPGDYDFSFTVNTSEDFSARSWVKEEALGANNNNNTNNSQQNPTSGPGNSKRPNNNNNNNRFRNFNGRRNYNVRSRRVQTVSN